LVTFHRRVAEYLPSVRSNIAALWPEHPPLRFLIDGGAAAPDVLVENESAFVPLLACGLARLRAELPGASHVLHMLEDHCPLQRCDGEAIERVLREATQRGLAAVSFATYQWPWQTTEQIEHPDGLVRTWRRIDIATLGPERLAVVPRDFFRYFQLQPTLWRIDYLQRICAEALCLGITDAWNFEAMQLANAEQHYVSTYHWPTVHHGFLMQGRINLEAVDYAARARGTRLACHLVKATIGIESLALFRAYRLLAHVARLPGRALNRVGAGYRKLAPRQ
jgi:hypothetical protein